jgi:uncharacterized membrane protein
MKRNTIVILVIAVFAVAAATFALTLPKGGEEASAGAIKEAAVNETGDLVIPAADITETPSFYAYNELDTKMEVIAVKASDGTIRTAFNTCQVCYNSGKGYYKLEGDLLTCQNCGNQFGRDQVEVTKGGCNPVPITDEYKKTDKDNITIPKEFMKEAQVIFENWKV